MTPTLTALDQRLFDDTGWFVIDVDQTKIGEADSLAHAMTLIEQGRAAAVVGRLAAGVTAVDVDAGGAEGDALADHLAGWLTARGRWHLLRPSGGGTGHWHVLCVPGTDTAALGAFVEDLRTTYGLPRILLDHRGAGGASRWLRPLSSPHRHTGLVPRPLGTHEQLRAALTALRALTALQRPARAAARSARARRADRAADIDDALVPLPRRQRELDPRWSAWLEGRGPAPAVSGTDQSRSTTDLAATSALIHAGRDVDQAWAHVLTAAGGAFERSRTRGRAWWTRHHWNHAVAADTAWRTNLDTPPTEADDRTNERPYERPYERPCNHAVAVSTSEDTRRAVSAARAALPGLQWQFGPRQRHSILLVAHTLLDRMLRVDDLAVPCPLRDLELDTGLARGTVLAALRALHGPLGRRVEAFDHTHADTSSHIFELDPRHAPAGVSLPEPPSYTPPTPTGTWTALPPTAHTLWRALPDHRQPSVETTDLAQAAGLTHGPTQDLTPRQSRTFHSALAELETAGLATHTPSGHWHRSTGPNRSHERRGAATHRLIHKRITRERLEYRSGTWNRWHRERLAALRQQRTRQHIWWDTLPPHERDARQRHLSARYATLPQAIQAEHRHHIATARHRAGEPSERSRHAGWCRQFTRADQADASAAWQARFAALSPHDRRTRAEHLDQHRRTWHLPPSWSSTAAPARARPHPAAA